MNRLDEIKARVAEFKETPVMGFALKRCLEDIPWLIEQLEQGKQLHDADEREIKRLVDENAELMKHFKAHLNGILSGSVTFDEIDAAKEFALKKRIKLDDSAIFDSSPYKRTRIEIEELKSNLAIATAALEQAITDIKRDALERIKL